MFEIIPNRIKLARKLCRFSMDDLVREMGNEAISKMAISKIERGLMRPSSTTLQAIAKACRQPLEFFCKPILNLGDLEYRFREEVTQRQRSEIKAAVQDLLTQYLEKQTLEGNLTKFVHPLRNVVLRNYSDTETAAIRLRRKWEIGTQPIHSVYELLQNYGIHVLELDFGCNNVDGVSGFVNHDIPIIIINARTHVTTERKRFTALHELCHLLFRLCPDNMERHAIYLASLPMVPFNVVLKQPCVERLCNSFASAMLLPESSAQRRFGTIRTEVSVAEFISTRNLYGISIAAQIHRLHDLRIIDELSYHHLFETIIHPNRLEEGLGLYPIMETADHPALLEVRLREEMKNINII